MYWEIINVQYTFPPTGSYFYPNIENPRSYEGTQCQQNCVHIKSEQRTPVNYLIKYGVTNNHPDRTFWQHRRLKWSNSKNISALIKTGFLSGLCNEAHDYKCTRMPRAFPKSPNMIPCAKCPHFSCTQERLIPDSPLEHLGTDGNFHW